MHVIIGSCIKTNDTLHLRCYGDHSCLNLTLTGNIKSRHIRIDCIYGNDLYVNVEQVD